MALKARKAELFGQRVRRRRLRLCKPQAADVRSRWSSGVTGCQSGEENASAWAR